MMAYPKDQIPLYVDLDGTFFKSDTLYEGFLNALKKNPLVFFNSFIWLLKGVTHFKEQIAFRSNINFRTTPVNQELFSFITKEKSRKREIILATASNEMIARKVCNNYDVFNRFIASDSITNLKGIKKLNRIKTENANFAYAGNHQDDKDIFLHATESYLVNPRKRSRKLLQSDIEFTNIFDLPENNIFKSWIKSFRIHQWLKNLLIFVPWFVSGKFLDFNFFKVVIVGFIAFSLMSSATYILNDIMDIQADRSHPRKKFRPLAHGDISIIDAFIGAIIMLGASALIAIALSGKFAIIMLVYLLITLMYSVMIKHIIILDVIILAILFTIRIIAGGAILDIPLSFWLLSFSIFVFFSLSLIKRCTELKMVESCVEKATKCRSYETADYHILKSLGISASLLSVLLFIFYTNSNILTQQYQEPMLLWLIIPFLGYWLFRMWIITNRGKMHDDPIIFTMKDRTSLIIIGIMLFIALLAQLL